MLHQRRIKTFDFDRFPKIRELKDQWIAKIRLDEGGYFAATENTPTAQSTSARKITKLAKMKRQENCSEERCCSSYFEMV